MDRDSAIEKVMQTLSRRLGKKLAAKMGKGRLLDVASMIAHYEEQAGWPNTPSETRRLVDKIRYIPAEFGMNLHVLRLSRRATTDVNAALWDTLRNVFPSLDIKPSEFVPS